MNRSENSFHTLSEEEKQKVTIQVDYFMELVARKYDVAPNDVLEAVKWVRERKDFADKVKNTSVFSLLGILGSAVMFAIWEGIKAVILGNVHK